MLKCKQTNIKTQDTEQCARLSAESAGLPVSNWFIFSDSGFLHSSKYAHLVGPLCISPRGAFPAVDLRPIRVVSLPIAQTLG